MIYKLFQSVVRDVPTYYGHQVLKPVHTNIKTKIPREPHTTFRNPGSPVFLICKKEGLKKPNT